MNVELKDLLTAAILPERRIAIERAIADIERLQREWAEVCKDYSEARAENERLRADKATLRGALLIAREWMPSYPIDTDAQTECAMVDDALARKEE